MPKKTLMSDPMVVDHHHMFLQEGMDHLNGMWMRGESTADPQEVTQQQEENVEDEGDKDEEEVFHGITSFPFSFLHIAVLRISFS